jgi:hypothetical protein
MGDLAFRVSVPSTLVYRPDRCRRALFMNKPKQCKRCSRTFVFDGRKRVLDVLFLCVAFSRKLHLHAT